MLVKIQNILLFCGYNFWTDRVAYIMGFAKRVKEEHGGVIPCDPLVLKSFYGISDKVLNLILQDGFPDGLAGIVCDSHVAAALKNLAWTKERTPERMAVDVQSWLEQKYYKPLNESIAGLRQLWRDKANTGVMLDAAEQLGIKEEFLKVVKGVDQQTYIN